MLQSLGKKIFKNRIKKEFSENTGNLFLKKVKLYKESEKRNASIAYHYQVILGGEVKKRLEEVSAEDTEKLEGLFSSVAKEAKREFDKIDIIVCSLDFQGSNDVVEVYGMINGTKVLRKIEF